MKRGIVVVLVVLSVAGLSDAAYLTAQHYRGAPVNCEIGGTTLGSCTTVLNSEYATVAGIPISLFGAGYYFLALVLAALLLTRTDKKLLKLLTALAAAGTLVSLGLLYVQAQVLEAYCPYCILSALISTALFLIALYGLRQFRSASAESIS